VVASNTCVGKNWVFNARYSADRSRRARLLSSINGVTSAFWAADAVMSVWPKPTIAEIIVPVPSAVTTFFHVPASIVLDIHRLPIETTSRTASSKPVLVQNISRIGFERMPLASADTRSPPWLALEQTNALSVRLCAPSYCTRIAEEVKSEKRAMFMFVRWRTATGRAPDGTSA
jgi:hypothetical protein